MRDECNIKNVIALKHICSFYRTCQCNKFSNNQFEKLFIMLKVNKNLQTNLYIELN